MLLPSYASIRTSSKKFEKRYRQESINIDGLLFHQIRPRNKVESWPSWRLGYIRSSSNSYFLATVDEVYSKHEIKITKCSFLIPKGCNFSLVLQSTCRQFPTP